MKFGDKLREMRAESGWTQKELADAAGTNQQSVARWEAGEVIPGFDAVQSLCVAFGVPLTAFAECTHGAAKVHRGRGRPPKAETKPVKAKKKK